MQWVWVNQGVLMLILVLLSQLHLLSLNSSKDLINRADVLKVAINKTFTTDTSSVHMFQ